MRCERQPRLEPQRRKRLRSLIARTGSTDNRHRGRHSDERRDAVHVETDVGHAPVGHRDDEPRLRPTALAHLDDGSDRSAHPDVDHHPLVDLAQYGFRQSFSAVGAHPATRVLVGVLVDLPREVVEVRLLRMLAKPHSPIGVLRLVTLPAAGGVHVQPLSYGRCLRGASPAPLAWLRHRGLRADEGVHVGNPLIR